MRKLKKPRNYRTTRPRCCLGCKHRIASKNEIESLRGGFDETMICERDGNPREDNPEFMVCDYYSV